MDPAEKDLKTADLSTDHHGLDVEVASTDEAPEFNEKKDLRFVNTPVHHSGRYRAKISSRRGLEQRHIQMIALAGTIGTVRVLALKFHLTQTNLVPRVSFSGLGGLCTMEDLPVSCKIYRGAESNGY
jgi:hypothetical protein